VKFTFTVNQSQQATSGPFKTKIVYMGNKEVPKQFRILPAFGPEGTANPLGWMPFETPDGFNSPWCVFVQQWSNIGHGPWGRGGNRKSFVRFDSFIPNYGTDVTPDNTPFDAVQRVVDAARNCPEWRYLFEKTVTGGGGKSDSILRWSAAQEMMANVVILSSSVAMPHTVLGNFSASLTRQLCGGDAIGNGEAEAGIINQLSNLDPRFVQQDPMAKYWLGDITDPSRGVVLEVYRDESTVPARYKIRPVRSEDGGIAKMPLNEQLMRERLDLSKPESFVTPPTPQEEVDRLAGCLNAWSPDRKNHEYELLHIAFDDMGFKVPDIPARGNVVGGGFVPPQELQGAESYPAPARAAYPVQYQQPQPQYNTPQGFNPGSGYAPQGNSKPAAEMFCQQPAPQATPAPAPQPAQTFVQPQAQFTPPPAQPAYGAPAKNFGQAPTFQPQQEPQQAPGAMFQNIMPQQPAQQPPQPVQPTSTPPVVPGTPIQAPAGGFNSAEFMQRLTGGQG